VDPEIFREIKSFVGFREEDARALLRLRDWLVPELDALAEAFYAAILSHPGARRVFRDEAQVERLKETLKTWAVKLCAGPHDLEYLRLRARIGRIHVQIGLPQRYMPTAMSVVRQFLLGLIPKNEPSREAAIPIEIALHRILDCELAIMLETYHEDLLGKLGRSERLAALGAVAVAVNHELKNPLGVLKTSVDAMRRQLATAAGGAPDERLVRHLDKLDRNLNKMQRNITCLLEFARSSEPAYQDCDVHSVIEAALEEVAFPPGIRVSRRFDPALRAIQLDPAQMERVFVNLAQNACEAMGERGELALATAAVPGGIRITFEDSGPGVPEDLREQIFTPLWTGRPGGTGMGLAICRNLVEAHRGRIWVDAEGPGARFQVELPWRGEAVKGP
jgi:signal transduction histidine kinase